MCGYGAGALVMSPVAAREILSLGVPATFLTLGIAYLILVVITAQFYQNPPQGWRPAGWEPRSAVSKAASTYDFTVREAMSTPQFWLLLVMLFLERLRRDHDHQSGFTDGAATGRAHSPWPLPASWA